MGRLGQRYSHAPQPMQTSSATVGTILPSLFLTIIIAPTGQWREQLPHADVPLAETHKSRFTLAVPIWVMSFSSFAMGSMAPAGHT